MQEEFDALIENRTWDLIPWPPNANVIRSLWIFQVKTKSAGSCERCKARLVGDDKSQREGIDCEKTFSPVVKLTNIRIVLSIVLFKSWSIHQLDVKNVFLHGHLTETVYMHQLWVFVILMRQQDPRAWYQRFADFVTTIGFCNSISDNSLFIYCHDSDIAYLLLYVDDIILTASSNVLHQSIMFKLSSEFSMKNLGPLSYFLGIAVTHISIGLFLS